VPKKWEVMVLWPNCELNAFRRQICSTRTDTTLVVQVYCMRMYIRRICRTPPLGVRVALHKCLDGGSGFSNFYLVRLA
jgi:hypothetical protein